MKLKDKNQKLLFLTIFFSLIGLLLRGLYLWQQSIPFTYDQGRDLLEIREMIVLRKIRLIGPTTSLHGVFSGPFWYWLSLPIYIITHGSPLTTELSLLLLSFVVPIIFYLLISDKTLGLLISLIYIFSYKFFKNSVVPLNTNPMNYITPLFILCLTKFFIEKKGKFLWITLFLVGASFHFEALIGIFMIPTLLASVVIFRKEQLIFKYKAMLLGLLVPLLPQIIFDFRHNFIQLRAILDLVLQKGSSLTPAGGGLMSRLSGRFWIFIETYLQNIGQHWSLKVIFTVLITFLLINVFLLRKKKGDELFYLTVLTLIFLLMAFIGFVLYPYALWAWYLGSIDALLLTLLGLSLFSFSLRYKKLGWISFLLLMIFIFTNIARYTHFSFKQEIISDPANLRNRIKVIDLIYEESRGKGMNIYTFAPYVYDYPYQYLIWWRAKEKYKYLPAEFVYLPKQPKYIPAKNEADKLIPRKEADYTYLIIDPYNAENKAQEKWFMEWFGNFCCLEKKWQIGEVKIEKLKL